MGVPRLVCIVGTRPEGIKMAPVVLELRKYSSQIETVLVSTGQHKEMLSQALAAFGLTPDHDLQIMQHGQSLAEVTSRALQGIDQLLGDPSVEAPAFVLGQGDTTTCFCAALAAFYRRVPFAHIEAGLRTDQIDNPFPEEFNRRAAGLVAHLHFAPTKWAASNLLREGKPSESVYVTGNTGIDAVLATAANTSNPWDFGGQRVVVLTTHRRENWGEPQARIARAALKLVEAFSDIVLVVAMHRNPQVRAVLQGILQHERVRLIEPPDYEPFVQLMRSSSLILTDSGGVQEEAPAFGVPVLVLRETTERPEAVEAGTARLVGTDESVIFEAASQLLAVQNGATASVVTNPYGDGRAAARIRSVVMARLGLESEPEAMWVG